MAEPEILDATAEGELSPFLQAVQEPIAPDAPCGSDVTYDDDFMQMKSEIDKLATAAADQVDFKLVIEHGRKILTLKSKDLRVAVFLTLALYREGGLAALAEGIAATRTVTETFWEDAFPPVRRMSGRRNALQLLSDRLKEWLADDKPTLEDRDAVEQAQEQAKALQLFCMETMKDDAPALSGLTKALENLHRRLPKPASKPQEPEGQTATPSTASAAPAAASDGAQGIGDVRSVNEARREVLRMSNFIREKDLKAPEAYAIARATKWSVLDDLPHENGKTLVEAPPQARCSFLSGLLTKGEYERLVREAEESFREPPFHFWLDLQRLMATALEALGSPYRAVHQVVVHGTAVLVHRLPELERLAFSDGTPFADPMTQEWIKTDVKAALSGGGGGGVTVRLGRDHLEEQYEAVRKQAGRGDLRNAVVAMQEGQEHDTTTQDRFVRRLYVAELCVQGGQPGVARSMLEALDEAVARHELDTWEPALALRVWSSLHRCYQLLGNEQDDQKEDYMQRAHRVFDKICRINAGYALAELGMA